MNGQMADPIKDNTKWIKKMDKENTHGLIYCIFQSDGRKYNGQWKNGK